jgi:hypothetical protein
MSWRCPTTLASEPPEFEQSVPAIVPEPVAVREVETPADNIELAAVALDNTPEDEYGYDPSLDEAPFGHSAELIELPQTAASLWNGYYEAVVSGQNLGGSEADLIARAEDMNLMHAAFVGYSDEQGHHISAVEIAIRADSGGCQLPGGRASRCLVRAVTRACRRQQSA